MSDDVEFMPTANADAVKASQLEAKRIGDEEREREERESANFFEALKQKAALEIAAWAATKCGGELVHVTACSDAIRDACERRDHRMCPRHRLVDLNAQEAERKRSRRRALLQAGTPEEVLAAVYDREPQETEALRKLRGEFAKMPPPRIVVLQGGVGCGKTCAATVWCVDHGGTFVGAQELAQLSPYEDKGRALFTVSHLVIDDLGIEYVDAKGFLQSFVDGLVTARFAAGRPTVITTNLVPWSDEKHPQPQFFNRYGERIADRVREAGAFIAIGGGSLRRRDRK